MTLLEKLRPERKDEPPAKVLRLKVDSIAPSPYQARTYFDPAEVESLAQSIRENGLLQPVSVRRLPEGGYQLIAGERRLRACKLAGLKEIPALVCQADGTLSAVLGYIENAERCDLNCFEQARALKLLLELWECTQEEGAARLGMSQSALCNKLRLLKHSSQVLTVIRRENLTERHARALLKLPGDEEKLSAIAQIARQGMNVARTEKYIEMLLQKRQDKPQKANVGAFLNNLTQYLARIQSCGIAAVSERRETEKQIVLTITIPKYAKKEIADQS